MAQYCVLYEKPTGFFEVVVNAFSVEDAKQAAREIRGANIGIYEVDKYNFGVMQFVPVWVDTAYQF